MGKNYLAGIILLLLIALVSGQEEKKTGQIKNNYCAIREFTDLDYYLFCDVAVNSKRDANGIDHEYFIIGANTPSIEDGKRLYQEFNKGYLTRSKITGRTISYISPDCKWVIAKKEPVSGDDPIRRQILLYEGKKKTERMDPFTAINPIIIVKSDNAYAQMDEEIHSKLETLADKKYFERYFIKPILNEQGNLAIGAKFNSEMEIWDIADGTTIWKFRFTENEMPMSNLDLVQFWGDKTEGKVIIEYDRNFYKISYPSNEVEYIGRDMYSLCYSPDRKYAAYSSCYNERAIGDEEADELEKIAPGIYIMEVSTGRTAYIEQDIDMWELCRRVFVWVEKENFEKRN